MNYEITNQPNNQKVVGHSLDNLRAQLDAIEEVGNAQVWLSKENGESFCALFNEHGAWLLWLEDDNGAVSFNPDYTGPDEAIEVFYLENGQLDEMLAQNCVDKEKAIRALLYYFEHGQKPDWLDWRA
jgi:hypothetical protein